jgi:hypothetical protein
MSMLFLGIFTNYFGGDNGYHDRFLCSDVLGIYNAALRLALLTKFGLFAIDAFTVIDATLPQE